VVNLPPEPLYLDADTIRLAQVFANLLNNAAKYTPPGGRIAVSVMREQSLVSVTVQDSGIGIPTDMLTRVFEAFTQLDHSLERSRGGLGIGLALARRLVEMHGGTIEAHSSGPGEGSHFVVRLPLSAQQGVPRSVSHESRVPTPALGRHRILVADDNNDSATSLGILLNEAGYEVRTAGNGVQALETAEQFRPDIALLDIGMPQLNGYDVARQLRNQPWGRRLLLIAVTGWGGADHRQQTAQAGFDHHLTKPVDPAALTRFLAAALAEGKARVSGSSVT
jgi:CheY-like chemotaxis protein